MLLSCSQTSDSKAKENQLKENIIGNWEMLHENDNSYTFQLPQGMTISDDSIEFYLGFFKIERDSITGERTRLYFGNSVPYKTSYDSIIYKNPLTDNWVFGWKFVCKHNDTLELAINDTTIIKYRKLYYNLDTLPDFDQIIYSSSGCFGSCPIIDISITKEGDVLFLGQDYVNPHGYYSGKLDTKTKNFIFNKFRQANPLGLQNDYSASHTDDQSLTTTFIQNGKIVKTIQDYGKKGPKELIWAYVPISNIHSKIHLKSLQFREPSSFKLHYFIFKKDGLILPLEKSESFYLWTELKKAKKTDKQFKLMYKLNFSCNHTYWKKDPNKKYKIKTVSTNGQYYKFEFKDNMPIIYDLGYNFIDRNFKQEHFRKPAEWEEWEE